MTSQQSPQDGPIFDRNTWLAIVVTFGFFIVWQKYIEKNYPQDPPAKSAALKSNNSNSDKESLAGKSSGEKPSGALSKKDPETLSDDTEKPELSQVSGAIEESASRAVPAENLTQLDFPETFSLSLTKDGMGFRNIVLHQYRDRKNSEISFQSKVKQWVNYFSAQSETSIQSIPSEVSALNDAPLFGTSIGGQLLNFDVKRLEDNLYEGQAQFSGGTVTKKIQFLSKVYSADVQTRVTWNAGAPKSSIGTHFFNSIKAEKASMMRPSYEGTDFFTYSDLEDFRERQVLGEAFKREYKNVSMTAIASQYFALALIDKSDLKPSSESTLLGETVGVASTHVTHGPSAKETTITQYKVYFGPKDRDILIAVDPNLEKVIDYGFFGFIAKPILRLLKFLHSLLGNWGLAIILLTLGIRLLLLPIALSSMRSMKKMQKIQPMLKQIKEKFKDNPQQANLETIALMKKEGANPISGCLPMFAQIPIFFALYSVLGVAIELYQSPFFFWIKDLSWKDPFYILPVVVTGLFFLQTRMSPSSMDENQKKMMALMPVIFGVFMLSLPAGLMVYFLTNNIFGIGQQYYVNKERQA